MSNKIATLVGCAIGDALGNPFEEKPASYIPLQQWDGFFKAGGTYWKGNAGQYTDDTLMSIALAGSLIRCKGFDPKDVSSSYLDWYLSGNTRGIGTTTAQAMHNLKTSSPWDQSGITNPSSAGNGSAMRASPIGLFYRNDLNKVIAAANLDAIITHNSIEPKAGSVAIATAVAMIANGVAKHEVLKNVIGLLPESEVRNRLSLTKSLINNGDGRIESLEEIGTSGYVVETVGAAFYCFIKGDNFKDTVISAVKAGSGRADRDTIGAIVGAMAGTYYGLEGIPLDYRVDVEGSEMLQIITDALIGFPTQHA